MTVDSMVQGVKCLCQVRWWRLPRVLDRVWELPTPQNACLLSRRPPPLADTTACRTPQHTQSKAALGGLSSSQVA